MRLPIETTAEFELKDFKVLSTGVDGGHHYISSVIHYKDNERNLTVIFKNKAEEKRLANLNAITVRGFLQDDGSQLSLTLLESEIIG